MNRPYTPEEYARLLAELRRRQPDLAVSTDLMVGFPGESEAEFQESLDFLEAQQFSRVHVFPFRHRRDPGRSLPGRPRRVLEERKKKALWRRGRSGRYASCSGQTEEVCWKRKSPGSGKVFPAGTCR